MATDPAQDREAEVHQEMAAHARFSPTYGGPVVKLTDAVEVAARREAAKDAELAEAKRTVEYYGQQSNRRRAELATLRERAVILPENWREHIEDVTGPDASPDDATVVDLIESWSAPAGSEATPSVLQVPPSLGANARPAASESPTEPAPALDVPADAPTEVDPAGSEKAQCRCPAAYRVPVEHDDNCPARPAASEGLESAKPEAPSSGGNSSGSLPATSADRPATQSGYARPTASEGTEDTRCSQLNEFGYRCRKGRAMPHHHVYAYPVRPAQEKPSEDQR